MNTMPVIAHLLTPELRKKLSSLGVLSSPSTTLASPVKSTPNGDVRLEFEFFDEMQACVSNLYANCTPGFHYWDEARAVWVLFVTWSKAEEA